MKHENETQAAPVTIEFLKQGGGRIRGTVTGRKGTQLQIAYRITSGEDRERWIPKGRLFLDTLEGDLETVTRFKGATCPATKIEPVLEHEGEYRLECTLCGGVHRATTERREREYQTADEARNARGWAFCKTVDGSEVGLGWQLANPARAGKVLPGFFVAESWITGYSSRKLADVEVTS